MICEECCAETKTRSKIITYSVTDNLLYHTVTEACSRCGATLNTCKGEGFVGTCKDCEHKDTLKNKSIGEVKG